MLMRSACRGRSARHASRAPASSATRPTTPRGPAGSDLLGVETAVRRQHRRATPSCVRQCLGSAAEMKPTPDFLVGIDAPVQHRRPVLARQAPPRRTLAVQEVAQPLERRADTVLETVELPLQVGAEQEHLELVALVGEAPAEFAAERRSAPPFRRPEQRAGHAGSPATAGRQQQLALQFVTVRAPATGAPTTRQPMGEMSVASPISRVPARPDAQRHRQREPVLAASRRRKTRSA